MQSLHSCPRQRRGKLFILTSDGIRFLNFPPFLSRARCRTANAVSVERADRSGGKMPSPGWPPRRGGALPGRFLRGERKMTGSEKAYRGLQYALARVGERP